jgi:hypothetical protein
MLSEFAEGCCLPLTEATTGGPLTLTSFDPSEELIWSASGAGMVYSHLLPTAEPYSAFRIDAAHTPPLGIFPNPFGLVALTHDAVRIFSKGGMQHAEVRRDAMLGATCGCLCPSHSSTKLAVVAQYDPDAETQLSLLDLGTAEIASSVTLDSAATLARYEPRSSLLCLSGRDGTVRSYDMRAAGARPVGTCTLFPSKAHVICDFDMMGQTLVASALRSRLGPMGQNEFTLDTTLKTLDLRSMRPTADIFTTGGACALKWCYGDGASPPKIIAAAPSGHLSLHDASGSMAAPIELELELSHRGAQLTSLDVCASEQMVAAADAMGCLTIATDQRYELDTLQSNPYVQVPELPEPYVGRALSLGWLGGGSAGSTSRLGEVGSGRLPLLCAGTSSCLTSRSTGSREACTRRQRPTARRCTVPPTALPQPPSSLPNRLARRARGASTRRPTSATPT